MSDETSLEPTIKKRRRLGSVWFIPLIALTLAGWLVWKNYAAKGPLVTVTFDTAGGLSVGKTEVRCRSVKVGYVEGIKLSGDLQRVNISVRIDPESSGLLRKNSRFWVVRPRISAQSVTGVDTLISGAYIELDPGDGKKASRHYKGLEEPPITPSNVPGLRLHLYAQDAGSLNAGAPIYYHEYEVGRIERRTFDVKNKRVHFQIFIEEEFAPFVRGNTRFWNASGIKINAGADGFKVTSPSLRALLAGGVSFSIPENEKKEKPAQNGDHFKLHKDRSIASATFFDPDYKLLLFFDQSVRGLKVGAPVEFRGISFGRVSEISFKYSSPGDVRVPVLIEVDTYAMGKSFASEEIGDAFFSKALERGLHAKLSTASLLTGALFVEFQYDADHSHTEMKHVANYPVIPTVKSGLDLLETKVNNLLSKLEALPLEETITQFGTTADEASLTLKSARTTMKELDQTLADIHKILGTDDAKQLGKHLDEALVELRKSIQSLGPEGAVQGDLRRSLDEFRAAMRSIDKMSDTINEKPNSLLFGRDSSGNPIPKARK